MTKKTTIRVRIDELEYTRSGLRTRQAMPLTVGALNRVELVRPDRVRTIKGGMVGFAKGSAFPTPGALMAFWRARAKGSAFAHHGASDGRWSSEVFQVYGHADRDGDETSNKALAERRARAGHALIVHDVDVFVAVSEEDSWDTAQFQSMLRTLACDGGPVDGKEERLTRQGVATFVERYNRGVYHHATNTGPTEQLEEDDTLNAANKKAIMEAFVLVHGIGLDASVSHPTHPWHGCGQYNARSFEAIAPNRRLSIIPHDAVVELSENAPCTQGDAQACAVVDDELQRCMWYREHVIDPSPPSPALFDPRWLWLG